MMRLCLASLISLTTRWPTRPPKVPKLNSSRRFPDLGQKSNERDLPHETAPNKAATMRWCQECQELCQNDMSTWCHDVNMSTCLPPTTKICSCSNDSSHLWFGKSDSTQKGFPTWFGSTPITEIHRTLQRLLHRSATLQNSCNQLGHAPCP